MENQKDCKVYCTKFASFHWTTPYSSGASFPASFSAKIMDILILGGSIVGFTIYAPEKIHNMPNMPKKKSMTKRRKSDKLFKKVKNSDVIPWKWFIRVAFEIARSLIPLRGFENPIIKHGKDNQNEI